MAKKELDFQLFKEIQYQKKNLHLAFEGTVGDLLKELNKMIEDENREKLKIVESEE